MVDRMKQNSTVTLMRGFLSINQCPSKLKFAILLSRFALVTNTFDTDVEDAFKIDAKSILAFSRQICEGRDIETSLQGENEVFHTPEEAVLETKLSENLFELLTARANGEVQLQMLGVCWFRTGA